jgi:hypothetical protein
MTAKMIVPARSSGQIGVSVFNPSRKDPGTAAAVIPSMS